MRLSNLSISYIALFLLATTTHAKKKKTKKAEPIFDSKTLKCLVCKSLVEEIEAEIFKVDPAKKVEVGTFRLKPDGTQQRTVIPYARSQQHLGDIVDSVCKNFEDYAQAKSKSTGEATIIRLMTHEGNMNPKMSEVDIVPDDDLNTRLKFYCENIVEDMEEVIMEMFAEEAVDNNRDIDFCSKRSSLCEPMDIEDDYIFEKEEL